MVKKQERRNRSAWCHLFLKIFGINKEEKKLKKELKLEKTLTSISGLTRLPDETHEEFVARVNEKCKTTQKKIQKVLKKCINTALTTTLEWD